MSNDPMRGANARRPWTRPGDLAPHTRGVHMSTPIDPATFTPIPGENDPIVTQLAHALYAAASDMDGPTDGSEQELAASDPEVRQHYVLLARAAYRIASRKVFPHAVVENFA